MSVLKTLAAGLLCVGLIVSCGDGANTSVAQSTTTTSEATATTATSEGATTTTSSTTAPPTTAAASTTTATTVTTEVRYGYVYASAFPEILGNPLDAAGSGCDPGAGPLPDGIWFGFPDDWTESSIDFDLACFYVGQAAVTEAANRGEESPPPNDYLITNDNPSLRAVPVAKGAIGHRIIAGSNGDGSAMEPVPFSDFMTDPGFFQNCPTSPPPAWNHCLVWLYVNNGEVTEIVSQYVP